MRHWSTAIVIASAALSLALLMTTPSVRLDGATAKASAAGRHAAPPQPRHDLSPRSAAAGSRSGGCPLSGNPAGYRDPLAGATVTAKRIDQGVDYSGSGVLSAIGAGRVTRVATADTGWPGAFIEYQLLGGADSGCYVYYAEGVAPMPGLIVGETIRAGQPVATIIPGSASGIEIGWGSGDHTKSYAVKTGQWSAAHEANDIPSAAGLYFSSLIAALGGPPGKVQG